MKKDELILSEKQNTFNRILRFETDADITLTTKELEIRARWHFAFKVWIQKKFTEQQIVTQIKSQHGVSEYTARNDIYQAQALFGGSILSNKKFLLHHHAENIMLLIEKWKLDKSLAQHVPKLMHEYTIAIKEMPDELSKDKLPPPILNLFVVDGQAVDLPTSYEEAIARMESRQKKKLDNDFTDYEVMPDDK
jgi:hypothetical protein